MPADYHHSLYLATSETYPNGLILRPNLKDLIATHYPDAAGPVEKVAVEFQTLYYKPIPEEAEIITLYYYKNPDEITLVSDLLSWIPSHLQKPLMVNYLVKELFSQIEEGIDGQTPNTTKYMNFYGQALMMMEAFYPKASKPYYKVTSTPVWY
jgi:hypothetical protein